MRKDRRYELKQPKLRDRATPELIATLAEPCDVETTVELARRVGTTPFDKMTTDEAIAEMRRLWPLHADAATEVCVKRYGAGSRPTLWWCDKRRPYVRPRDWNSPDDGARFASERKAADVEFLRQHKCLSKEELADLQGMER